MVAAGSVKARKNSVPYSQRHAPQGERGGCPGPPDKKSVPFSPSLLSFLLSFSHELRSPLAVMRTTVEALIDELSPQLAEILIRQVERIDHLTTELYVRAGLTRKRPGRAHP